MIPNTKNNLPAMALVSMMQKAIRRSEERLAMEAACELIHTSKGFHTLVCNRLEIASHEDVGDPQVILFVSVCMEQARRLYDPKKIGKSRMFIGNAIRMMCRAPKSREGDHFSIAVGVASELGFVPTIPDWAFDQHTQKGKAMGRGLAHFRGEGARLVPPPPKDRYEDEAFAMLEKKQSGKPKRDLYEE